MLSTTITILISSLLSLTTADFNPNFTPICDEFPAGHVGWGNKDNFDAAKAAIPTACQSFQTELKSNDFGYYCADNLEKNGQFVFMINNDNPHAMDFKQSDCEAAMTKLQDTCHFGGRSANFTDLYYSTYPSWGKCVIHSEPTMSLMSHSSVPMSTPSVHARDAEGAGTPVDAVPTAETTLDPDDMASVLWRRLHPDAQTAEDDTESAEPTETAKNFWRRLLADEHPDI